MTTLFVAAEARECAGWVQHWQECRPANFPVRWAREGLFRGRKVTAVANGAGEARARAAFHAVPDIETVVSIGLCGALDPTLQLASVVVAGEVRGSYRVWKTLDTGPALLTIDHIADTSEEKRTLRQTGASIVDMEAAGVAGAAWERGVPFRCIRAVSDLAEESFMNNLNSALRPDGSFSTGHLIWNALGDPAKRFGELIRLGRRSAQASKNLGDYLASCEL